MFSVVLLAGAIVLPAQQAPAAARQTPHVLTGNSVFMASSPAKTLVRFPRQLDFKEFQVSWEGDGRVKGFILRKLGSYEQEGLRPVMEGVSVARCKERGCKGKRDPITFTVCFCREGDLAGTWELYVIADGEPVRVRLRVKGEVGSDSVLVTQRVRSEIQTLEPRVDDQVTHSVVSAGDFTDLEDVGFGVVGIWTHGNPHAATAIGDCNYYDYRDFGIPSVFPPEEVAFLPGCPTGDGYVFPSVDPDGGSGGAFLTSAGFGDQVGLGGWYTTAAVVKDYGAVAFWVDF